MRFEFVKSANGFLLCIGTLNLTVGRNLFGVPPSGGPNRLKPGHQTAGSWRAPFRVFSACIETLNRVWIVAQTAQSAVSQVANLLAARRVQSLSIVPRSADWQSAIQQAGSLRYESVHGKPSFEFFPHALGP